MFYTQSTIMVISGWERKNKMITKWDGRDRMAGWIWFGLRIGLWKNEVREGCLAHDLYGGFVEES